MEKRLSSEGGSDSHSLVQGLYFYIDQSLVLWESWPLYLYSSVQKLYMLRSRSDQMHLRMNIKRIELIC